MGNYSSRRTTSGVGRTKKQLTSTSLKVLQSSADLFVKELKASDIKIWGGILWEYSEISISWAFEQWNRNGQFFPKPCEILALISAFGLSVATRAKLCGKCSDGYVILNPEAKPSDFVVRRCECVNRAIEESKLSTNACDSFCKSRHDNGYGEQDIRWLFKKRGTNSKRWSISDWETLLAELDKKRAGGPPKWRTEPNGQQFLRG